MKVVLQHSTLVDRQSVQIAGSKSQTNRLLVLQKIYPNILLENISDSDDSAVMQQALMRTEGVVDIHHAGTAMRFLTAYFAIQHQVEIVLTGSSRMKERPIKILVDALRQLGAAIEYVDRDGFPPLRIRGRKISNSKVCIAANVSSQYISALMLIAPQLPAGLEITFEGEITSRPYIEMTLNLLAVLGVRSSFIGNCVKIQPQSSIGTTELVIESDWSSASYFYSAIALSAVGTTITLSSFQQKSTQGDAAVAEYYRVFGVETSYDGDRITLLKKEILVNHFEADFIDTPDLAQTTVVTCFGLGMSCQLKGLHTLKIKETDRLKALYAELTKLGAEITTTADSLFLKSHAQIISGMEIDTYQDHRMAMSFAPLALKTNLIINDAKVVSKSFVNFWEQLQSIGFTLTFIDSDSSCLK